MHRKEFGDQALSGLAWKLTALHRPLAGFMEWRGREREQERKGGREEGTVPL